MAKPQNKKSLYLRMALEEKKLAIALLESYAKYNMGEHTLEFARRCYANSTKYKQRAEKEEVWIT